MDSVTVDSVTIGYTPIHFYKRVAMDYTGLSPVRLLGCLTFPQSVLPFKGLNYHEILPLLYTTLLELFIHLVAQWLGKIRTKWTIPKSWGQLWITTDKGRGWLEKDAFFSECPLSPKYTNQDFYFYSAAKQGAEQSKKPQFNATVSELSSFMSTMDNSVVEV